LSVTIISQSLQKEYLYRSMGVLNVDENRRTFDIVEKDFIRIPELKDRIALQINILQRVDIVDVFTSDFRGEYYRLNLKNEGNGKHRVFKLNSTDSVKKWPSGIFLAIPATMCLFASLMCLFISFRWK
jgi:hypothetical protein